MKPTTNYQSLSQYDNDYTLPIPLLGMTPTTHYQSPYQYDKFTYYRLVKKGSDQIAKSTIDYLLVPGVVHS